MSADAPLLHIRRATRADLPAIVRLLADDALGRVRERVAYPVPASYEAAFEAIDADPRHELVVVEVGGALIGTLQLSFLPSLSHQGGTRAQIEAVRVAAEWRGRGIGGRMIAWAVERSRAVGCRLVQLTSDASRMDAHRFYARLGFAASHVGFKLDLHPLQLPPSSREEPPA